MKARKHDYSETVVPGQMQFLNVNYGICMVPVLSFFRCTVVSVQSCKLPIYYSSNEVNLNKQFYMSVHTYVLKIKM